MMTYLHNILQLGLEWEKVVKSFYPEEPIFTIEPSLDTIEKLVCRHLEATGSCEIAERENLADSSKCYSVVCGGRHFTLKTVLPLAPKARVLSEVATMSFIKKNTTIPTPTVIA
jgi:hypothetical protein